MPESSVALFLSSDKWKILLAFHIEFEIHLHSGKHSIKHTNTFRPAGTIPAPNPAPPVANYSSHKPENTFKIKHFRKFHHKPPNSSSKWSRNHFHSHRQAAPRSRNQLFHVWTKNSNQLGRELSASMLPCNVLINANFPVRESCPGSRAKATCFPVSKFRGSHGFPS